MIQKIDLLKEVYEGNITEDEGYKYFDKIPNQYKEGIVNDFGIYWDYLKINRVEHSLFHCVGPTKLAKWRYKGYPEKCVKCGKKIKIEIFGVMYMLIKGKEKLVHIDCSDKYQSFLQESYDKKIDEIKDEGKFIKESNKIFDKYYPKNSFSD